MVEDVTLEGLRAKFGQNSQLKEYLLNTHNLYIGEASTNPRWGIGMELLDDNALDHTKWSPEGNLLGRSLMKVREELAQQADSMGEWLITLWSCRPHSTEIHTPLNRSIIEEQAHHNNQ